MPYTAKQKRAHLKWRKTHPRTVKAHNALNKAIIRGHAKVKIPTKCHSCGKRGSVDKHHVNYAQPYKFAWLCRSCHMKIHADNPPTPYTDGVVRVGTPEAAYLRLRHFIAKYLNKRG